MENKNLLKLKKIKNNKIQLKKNSIFLYDVSNLELTEIIKLVERNGQVSVIKNGDMVNIYLVVSNENSSLKEYEVDFCDYIKKLESVIGHVENIKNKKDILTNIYNSILYQDDKVINKNNEIIKSIKLLGNIESINEVIKNQNKAVLTFHISRIGSEEFYKNLENTALNLDSISKTDEDIIIYNSILSCISEDINLNNFSYSSLKYAKQDIILNLLPLNTGRFSKNLFKIDEEKKKILDSIPLIKTTKNKNTQDSLPYRKIYENGIMEHDNNIYSCSLELKDISFTTIDEERQVDIFLKYCEFLNAFSDVENIQITMNNTKIDEIDFKKNIEIKMCGDDLDDLRKEYNDMILEKLELGTNFIDRKKVITVSINAKSIEEANRKFSTIIDTVQRNIKQVGGEYSSDVYIMDKYERLKMIFAIFNIDEIEEFSSIDLKETEKLGISSKDIISPDRLSFKSNYFRINEKYCKSFFIYDLPNSLNPSFFVGLNAFNEQIITTVNYKPLDQISSAKLVKNKLSDIETKIVDISNKYTQKGIEPIIPSHLKLAKEETAEMLEDITTRDQKLFKTLVAITIISKTKEELEILSDKVKDYCKLVKLKTAKFQQESAFNSSIPWGINQMPQFRTLTTEASSVFIPFDSDKVMHPHGKYYGVNPSNNKSLIVIDRAKSMNGNGFILGKSGTGKSFTAKREMLSILLENSKDEVVVIDPEGEYRELCKELGGDYIDISQSSEYHINLFDINENYSDLNEDRKTDNISAKSNFIVGCLDILTGNQLELVEENLLDKCIRQIYEEWFEYTKECELKNEKINYEYFPRLINLKDKLNQVQGFEKNLAKNLAMLLELFTTGSQNMFNYHTNCNPKARFVVYGLNNLGDNTKMKSLSMHIIMDQIWNRLLRNGAMNLKDKKRTWFYVDEIYLLFDNEKSSNFLRNIWKRARKYNGFPTGLTQNIEDLLNSDSARSMLSNAEFIVLMNQAKLDKVKLVELLSISESQQTYISNAKKGSGLICIDQKTILPFEDDFPTNTKMYELLTTTPNDINKKVIGD